jgi:phosphatidylserine/phosphatidylglycerophosphate/cardiolipin synthase-like enzyme
MDRIIPNNQITLLQNGEAYFPAIEAALDQAVHEVYLKSYIFENDNTGRRIAEALRRAALRDVKTHVLIDGFGSHSLSKTMVDNLKAARRKGTEVPAQDIALDAAAPTVASFAPGNCARGSGDCIYRGH